MDLPSRNDLHGEVIITGVESEEVEEVNDAYKDILEELGMYCQDLLPKSKLQLQLSWLYSHHNRRATQGKV